MQKYLKKYDEMTAAALDALLREDLYARPEEQLAPEEALYIAGLLAERKNMPEPDVAAAKARFYRDYYPRLAGEAVWGRGAGQIYQRFIGAAAILLFCIMFGGTVTAYALGYNPMISVTDLSRGVQAEGGPVTAELIGIMAESGWEKIVPRWLPEGYKQGGNELRSIDSWIPFVCSRYYRLKEGRSETLYITLGAHDMSGGWTERLDEKGFGNIRIYTVAERDHYIIGSDYHRTIMWRCNDMNCRIVGRLSEAEAVRMVDSIYE